MIRFVGYKKDRTNHDVMIYESLTDDNWAATKNSHINADDPSAVAFMLINFDKQTATISANGMTTTVDVDYFPTLAMYVQEVIEQMDAELTALIHTHGVTSTR